MSATDDLVAANARYASGFMHGRAPAAPRKKLAVITCMDARLDVYRALGLEPGDAHVIRNAGGLVSEDALRSLLISQHLLGTHEVVLIHHTGCGLIGLDERRVLRELELRFGARPPFELGGFEDIDEDVRSGIGVIRSATYLRYRGSVRGFVYEVDTGRLREVNGP